MFASFKRSGVGQERFDALFASVWDLVETPIAEGRRPETRPEVIYVHKLETLQPVLAAAQGCRWCGWCTTRSVLPRKHKYYFHNHKICTLKLDCGAMPTLRFSNADPRACGMPRSGQLKELRGNLKWDAPDCWQQLYEAGVAAQRIRRSLHPTVPPCVAPSSHPCDHFPLNLQCATWTTYRGKGVDTRWRRMHCSRTICATGHTPFTELATTGSGWRISSGRGIDDTVLFHGWVSHDELAQYYDGATLLAVPPVGPNLSVWWGWKRCCASGRWWLAGSGDSRLAVDGETGFLVPPDDSRAILGPDAGADSG